MDKEFCQYLTKYNDSNNKANKNNTLDDFEALIISINNAQELEPLENTEYFLILFSLLTCNNAM